MVHVIARRTGFDEDVVIGDFRKIYGEKGSLEYRYPIQELGVCRNLASEDVQKLVYDAWIAFSGTRRNRLKPYEGVRETLRWAADAGVRIIGVTNSPLDAAIGRLRQLNIDTFFDGLAAWEGADEPESFPSWVNEMIGTRESKARIKHKWYLPTSDLKPSANSYSTIMKDLQLSGRDTFVIGDSLNKDVAPALELGAIGIWAKYGTKYEARNFDTLLKITHWDQDKIATTYAQDSITPTYTILSFPEIKKVLGVGLPF